MYTVYMSVHVHISVVKVMHLSSFICLLYVGNGMVPLASSPGPFPVLHAEKLYSVEKLGIGLGTRQVSPGFKIG